ncbi:uncharacterized protein LOC125235128 [Leguminivora glycinivorella]|uniref:uncharacterized protein LOC125235128 n=1 Tax=Leguminivora glycinivorella TaxID=1035111 RepID=UPI00200F62AC|nr:uncharacterized protein LOC125235128 [Leguminivora glycinivorella]
MTNVLKCDKCNIVVDELLTFVQNKIDVMDEDSLCRICVSTFDEESIAKSKSLLFESIPTEKKKVARRNRNKSGKQRRDIEDIIGLFKGTDPELIPTFVARDLHLLPPVTFDHIDITDFLKKLTIMRAEIAHIKSTFVTQEQLEKVTNKFESYAGRQSASCNGHFLNVNMQRGAFIGGDSGPSGFSHSDLSVLRSTEDCVSLSHTLVASMQERVEESGDECSVRETVHNEEVALSPSLSRSKEMLAPSLRECEGTRDRSPVDLRSHSNTRNLPSNEIVLSPSCSRNTRNGPTPTSMQMAESLRSKETVSCETITSKSEQIVSENSSKVQAMRGDTGERRKEEWRKVESRKQRAKRNRFIGKTGMASLSPNAKFKAVETKLPLFITKVALETTKEDIAEYIEAKTGQKVTVYQIRNKDDQVKRHNSFKFYVDKVMVPAFLDAKLWPAGIVFRRFMAQKPPIEVNAANAANAASTIDGTQTPLSR